MENTIMRFCRETQQYSYSYIANHLGITVREYRQLERGELLITTRQAGLLGKLYKVKANYFYQAALQLKDLFTKTKIIRVMREEMEKFQASLPVIKKPKGN